MARTPYVESEVGRLGTIEILKELPGGRELLDWFDGTPQFGDSELIGVCLDRHGSSWLRLALCKLARTGRWDTIVVTMTLMDHIDVSLEGFSHQNVISDLVIQHNRRGHPSRESPLDTGITPPAHEIVLEPCFGAFGLIRATISSVTHEVRNDVFLWQR